MLNDLDSFKLENDLIFNSDHKNNETHGSITYILPSRPFADQAHDNYLMIDILDNNVMSQLKIDENQRNISKSQKQEFFLFSHSNKLHPQSSYISRYIHTLHIHDLLEEIKSGKSPDPNLLKFNESTTSRISTHSLDGETEIQSGLKNGIQTCVMS
ncbi:hypothetical protein Glove_233g22 [Diversispora epigaea]|uniref:Uncharacterized protein n=1 Tax=Diversispora epigaea TaxID=1348612 RepID=A0A397IB05_9GLOM|nr:hypothetical protein Glove_233g22 [Diversispora epigaea]